MPGGQFTEEDINKLLKEAVDSLAEKKAKAKTDAAGCFTLVVLIIVTLIVGVMAEGICLYYCWNWFVAPLGVPSVGIVHALALALTLRVFTGLKLDEQKKNFEHKSADEAIAALVGTVVKILIMFGIVLFIAYIYSCLM